MACCNGIAPLRTTPHPLHGPQLLEASRMGWDGGGCKGAWRCLSKLLVVLPSDSTSACLGCFLGQCPLRSFCWCVTLPIDIRHYHGSGKPVTRAGRVSELLCAAHNRTHNTDFRILLTRIEELTRSHPRTLTPSPSYRHTVFRRLHDSLPRAVQHNAGMAPS